ncbi:toxin-antitoxin system YwqK family antitoxin [Aquimarina rubra]|uniref:Toxin-antitoxin system YwqK family antitoxin n=1 Tax=Aquimarina rubra TaxID=1920033 RepID=A0ABW5LE70_9FLAO
MIISKKNILKFLFVCVAICNLSFKAFGQNDTIWYDQKWQESSKENAAFYRPPSVKNGDLYVIKDYYINGQLQMVGTSTEKDKAIWEGKVTWYQKDGKVQQAFTYKNNRLDGEFITYYKDQKLIAQYKDGRFFSGKTNFINKNSQTFREKKDSIIREVIYDKDLNGTRYEIYKKITKDYPKETGVKYYGNEGEYLGTSSIDSETGRYQGVFVYYYKNPLRVRKIVDHKYKGGRVKATYYPNGGIRERFIDKPEPKMEYYDQKGTLISTVGIGDPNKTWDFRDGKRVQFYSDSKPEEMHLIDFIEEFDVEGNITYAEFYHKNQQIQSKVFYEDKYKKEVISFDKSGNQIARVTFKNYAPFQGTLLDKFKSKVYEQGKLIKETNFYPDTTIPFSVFENKKAVFYNKNGDVLGEITSKSNSFLSEEDGTRYYIDFEGRIIRTATYVKGTKTYEKEYRHYKEDTTKTGIKERFYEGYNIIKEVSFYHDTPKKRSELFYKNGNKVREVFYDRTGKEVATYDYEQKDGTLFTYFYDTDVVDEYQEFAKGRLIKSIKYKKKYKRNADETESYVLIEDLDINTEAVFYNEEGTVIAKLVFKDKKPYEGVGYDYKSRTYYTFKDGKKNGSYKKMGYNQKVLEEGFYINDLRQAAFITYDFYGNKTVVKNYKNDKLEGETIYYNEKGEVVSKLVYKNDLPFEGKAIGRDEEIWYEQGTITKKIKTTENQVIVTNYMTVDTQEVIVYTSNKKNKIYLYTLKNYKLHGDVIRYDLKGNLLHKAKFDKGILKSGAVLVKENSYRSQDYTKLLIHKKEETISIECYNKDGEVVLEVKEKANSYGEYTSINKLGFYFNNIEAKLLL